MEHRLYPLRDQNQEGTPLARLHSYCCFGSVAIPEDAFGTRDTRYYANSDLSDPFCDGELAQDFDADGSAQPLTDTQGT